MNILKNLLLTAMLISCCGTVAFADNVDVNGVSTEDPQNTVTIDESYKTDSQAFLNNDNINQVHIIYDSKTVDFSDAQPFIDENSRIEIPIRKLSEMLGFSVEWIPETKSAVLTRTAEDGEITTLKITVGSNIIESNKQLGNFIMDTAPVIVNNRIYLPLRHISNALGYNVVWDEEAYTANLYVGAATVQGGVIYPEKLDAVNAASK